MEPEGDSLILAAHPDDETIGAGAWMARRSQRPRRSHRGRITIAHLTDGAPRDPSYARAAGFETREQYARARRAELYCAVAMAGIRPEQCRELGFIDQEAYLHLEEMVDRLVDLIDELRPELLLTHPYEGGHPDHDAAAFAAATAVAERPTIALWEFTGYHAAPQGIVAGDFLPAAGPRPHTIELTPSERALKQRMFDSFPTQRQVLEMFSLQSEKFRVAPRYDFTQPPHDGELLYERFGFAQGCEWRRRASRTLREFNPGIPDESFV